MDLDTINARICETFGIDPSGSLPLVGTRGDRNDLARLFAELGYTKGAEIGVCQGLFSEILCTTNPNLKLLCVDPWQPSFYTTPRKVRRYFRETKARLESCNVEIIRDFSYNVVQTIPDGSLDFVYIDALHEFNPAMLDIIQWAPKVRKNGIIAGHDFRHFQACGVIYAVEAYTRAHRIDPWYITRYDNEPSWFWVS